MRVPLPNVKPLCVSFDWTASARYNLARIYEHLGKHDQALPLYAPDDSPQSPGNQLRARALREKQKPAEDAPAK